MAEAPVLPPLDLSGAGIQISVIMPLHDYRFLEAFLETWGKHQTCEAGRYEIVVAAGPEHRPWEAGIRRHLRPQDRWLPCPGERLLRYAEGARQARGRILLFTEDHCVARRECLQTVFEAFHHTSTAGVLLRCGHINRGPLAEMEEEHERLWGGHHPWNQFRLRGTALRRDVYEQAGGLDADYHYFAEPALGLRLYEAGHRFALTPRECVRHVNSFRWSGMFHDIYRIAYGECAFRQAHPERDLDRLLGESAGWRERRRWHRGTRRAVRAAARAGFLSFFPKPGCRTFLLAWLESVFLPPRRLGLAEALLLALIPLQQLRCVLSRPGSRNAAFTQWLEGVGRYAAFRFHLGHTSRRPAEAHLELPGPGKVPADVLAGRVPGGFHLPETWEGRPLAWSQPLAMLWLKLPPGSWRIRLELAPVTPAGRPDALFLWNGKPLDPSKVRRTKDAFLLRVHAKESGPAALSWAVPAAAFPGDPRPLGLPVLALHAEAFEV